MARPHDRPRARRRGICKQSGTNDPPVRSTTWMDEIDLQGKPGGGEALAIIVERTIHRNYPPGRPMTLADGIALQP
ncbi:hypothetical protein RJ55_02351 [Drechmeria coniospora]|nr:hypothetical protein RJ55_02351 [Drechmeria coniospora]